MLDVFIFILSMFYMLKKKKQGKSPNMYRSCFNLSRSNSDKLIKVINSVLEMALDSEIKKPG